MKIVIRISVILILSYSCSSESKIDNRIYKFEKQTLLKEIDWSGNLKGESYKILYSDIVYPSSIDAFGYCGAFFIIELEKENFNSQYKYFQKSSIANYAFEDKCNLYITDSDNFDTISCNDFKFPLPDIHYDYSPLVLSKVSFSNESRFIILDYREGSFIEELSKEKPHLLNKRIKESGFCKGILIDEKNLKVVYWILIWKV